VRERASGVVLSKELLFNIYLGVNMARKLTWSGNLLARREHEAALRLHPPVPKKGKKKIGKKKKYRGEKRGKTVRNNSAWRDRALNAVLVEGIAKAEAEARGVDLTVSMVQAGKTEFPHWQFRDVSRRRILLHYWPTKGSWYDPGVGERGVYDSWEDALAHAAVRMDGKV
jgi:hypothetical protein